MIVLIDMRRYRVCLVDFDSRATMLSTEIQEDWEDKVKAQWKINQARIKEGFIMKYGVSGYEEAIERLKTIGSKPFSIISYHNAFLDQIRDAYIFGSYYPAITGCCALGERMLNHLILDLREDYPSEDEDISEIYTCKTSSNWNVMIKALARWGIFNTEIEGEYRELLGKRQRAIHFNKKLEPESDAVEAIKLIQEIIQNLIGGIGNPELFIPAKGEIFIKKEKENDPFVKKFYLPSCAHVTPYHKVISFSPYKIEDKEISEKKEISDDEFMALREEFKKGEKK